MQFRKFLSGNQVTSCVVYPVFPLAGVRDALPASLVDTELQAPRNREMFTKSKIFKFTRVGNWTLDFLKKSQSILHCKVVLETLYFLQ